MEKQYALIRAQGTLTGVTIEEITGWFKNSRTRIFGEALFYEFTPIRVFSDKEVLDMNIKLHDIIVERNKVVIEADDKLKKKVLKLFPELGDPNYNNVGNYTFQRN